MVRQSRGNCFAERDAERALIQARPTNEAGAQALIAAYLEQRSGELSGISETDEIDQMLPRSLAQS
jgi:hypothetical protein